jgi:hypothetical protein
VKLFLPNAAKLQNFEGLINRFDPANPKVLEFSMHDKWVSLHPAALAFAACIGDHVTASGGNHVGKIEDVSSLPYLQRMKLFDHVLLKPEKAIAEHEESGRFIPITRVGSSQQLGDFIVNMIPLLHATPKDVEPIRYVISEMGRNVLEHSRSPRGAFLAAQYYKDSRVLACSL